MKTKLALIGMLSLALGACDKEKKIAAAQAAAKPAVDAANAAKAAAADAVKARDLAKAKAERLKAMTTQAKK